MHELLMTKYEKVVLIGLRIKHLDMGAPPLVNPEDYDNNTTKMAEAEVELKLIPYKIIRKYPNNEEKTIDIKDFIDIDSIIPKTFTN